VRLLPIAIAVATSYRLHRKYRDYTMIPRLQFMENLLLVEDALKDQGLAGGAIIECGTWRGGMSAALVEIGGPNRDYYFFDSFEGLPPATEEDGAYAREWQAGKNNYENCSASLAQFEEAIAKAHCSRVHIKPGFFENSFPKFDPPPIAILRLDADWYESTMICLTKYWDHVLPGGLILIDDYHSWEGCSRAVHDLLSWTRAQEYILQGRIARVTYIRKRGSTAGVSGAGKSARPTRVG
jgi:O-methyltransferase